MISGKICCLISVLYVTLHLSSGRMQDGIASNSTPSPVDPTFPAMFTNRRPAYDPYKKLPTTTTATTKLMTEPSPPRNCCMGHQDGKFMTPRILANELFLLLSILSLVAITLYLKSRRKNNLRRPKDIEKGLINTPKFIKFIPLETAPTRKPSAVPTESVEVLLNSNSFKQVLNKVDNRNRSCPLANVNCVVVVMEYPEDEKTMPIPEVPKVNKKNAPAKKDETPEDAQLKLSPGRLYNSEV